MVKTIIFHPTSSLPARLMTRHPFPLVLAMIIRLGSLRWKVPAPSARGPSRLWTGVLRLLSVAATQPHHADDGKTPRNSAATS